MIVYVETNFILEMAFLREEREQCVQLIALAETKEIQLELPSFCVGESYEAAIRRWKRRVELREKLSAEMKELSRSQPYVSVQESSQDLVKLLALSNEEEEGRLNETLESVLSVAETIPIDLQVIRGASRTTESHSLSPQDSIVFASILNRLEQSSGADSCFITKNSRDFATAEVIKDLAAHGCKLLARFNDGLGYVRSKIAPVAN